MQPVPFHLHLEKRDSPAVSEISAEGSVGYVIKKFNCAVYFYYITVFRALVRVIFRGFFFFFFFSFLNKSICHGYSLESPY